MTNSLLDNLAVNDEYDPLLRAKAADPLLASLTLRYGSLELDSITHTCRVSGRPCPLTRLEYQLLAFLMFHQGRIWSREELIERAWQKEQSSPHAIAVYINSLRRKLGRNVVRTVHGQGYTIDTENSVQQSSPDRSGRRRRLFAERPIPALTANLGQHQGSSTVS